MMRFLILAVFVTSGNVLGSPNEHRLLDDLFAHYSPLVRPVANDSAAVKVTLDLTLLALDPVINTGLSYLDIVAWPSISWTDESLVWDASLYGGIASVRVPSSMIWIPDIAAYNEVGLSSLRQNMDNMPVVVYSTGAVNFIPQLKHRVICQFDRDGEGKLRSNQTCHIKFGSWTYPQNKLDLRSSEGTSLEAYSPNPCWSLVAAPVLLEEKIYDCCPEVYPDLKISFNLKKKSCGSRGSDIE